jgi:glycosyltransferase involved in cell wall biosynthesis
MEVLWIDPANADAHFLNTLALALAKDANRVTVRSNRRHGFEPPDNICWSPFSLGGTLLQTLEGKTRWRLAVASTYPLDWLRAVRFAKKNQARSVLVSSNLILPGIDAWGLRLLRCHGIAPVVLVHRPYRQFLKDPERCLASHSRAFYRQAARILVMTTYTRRVLQDLYDLPDDRFVQFALPHCCDLLSRVPACVPLRDSLRSWAASSPVVSFLSGATAEYGLETFIASLPFLQSLLPGVRVLIVTRISDIPKRRSVEQKVAETGFGERCLFRAEPYSYSDLLAYLSVTDVVALPYVCALQSSVIALAAGFGIPVVATSVGGLPEMVVPGKTGELVPPKNPRALAEGVARIVAPDALDSYKSAAAEFARIYLSPAKAAAIVRECLSSVTNSGTQQAFAQAI